MHTRNKPNIRSSERRAMLGTVQVSWPSPSGQTTLIRAKCLDVSADGVRIECQQPIEFRANVYLQAPAFGLMGNASVRYCRRSGMKHIVGLMFSSAASQGEQGRKRCLTESRPDAEK